LTKKSKRKELQDQFALISEQVQELEEEQEQQEPQLYTSSIEEPSPIQGYYTPSRELNSIREPTPTPSLSYQLFSQEQIRDVEFTDEFGNPFETEESLATSTVTIRPMSTSQPLAFTSTAPYTSITFPPPSLPTTSQQPSQPPPPPPVPPVQVAAMQANPQPKELQLQ